MCMAQKCKGENCNRMAAPGNEWCTVCRQRGKHRDGPGTVLARDKPDKYDDGSEDQGDTRKRNLFMRYGRVFR